MEYLDAHALEIYGLLFLAIIGGFYMMLRNTGQNELLWKNKKVETEHEKDNASREFPAIAAFVSIILFLILVLLVLINLAKAF